MVAQGKGVARFSGSYPNQQNCRDSGRAEARAIGPTRNGPATDGTGAPLVNRAGSILIQGPGRGQARRSGRDVADKRRAFVLEAGNHR